MTESRTVSIAESVRDPARHGLVLAAGSMLDRSDSDLIEAAAVAGFDAVGLRVSTGRTVAEIEAALKQADRFGIMIHDVEVHRISADTPDPVLLIEQTAALGAAALLVVSDLSDIAATVTALCDVTDRAAAAGVRVALEYMEWTNPRSPLDAIAMADEVGCELVVDVLHHHRVGAGPEEFEAIVASGRLGWLQLCDAPLAIPNWQRSESSRTEALITEARHGRLPPGHGELPLRDILALVPPEIPIGVEVQSEELLALEPVERARLLYDATRSVLDRLA